MKRRSDLDLEKEFTVEIQDCCNAKLHVTMSTNGTDLLEVECCTDLPDPDLDQDGGDRRGFKGST